MTLSAILSLIGNTMIDTNTSPNAASVLTLFATGFGFIGGTSYLALSGDALADLVGRLTLAAISVSSNAAELGKEFCQYQMQDLKGAQAILEEMISRCGTIISDLSTYEIQANTMETSTFSNFSAAAQRMENMKKQILTEVIQSSHG